MQLFLCLSFTQEHIFQHSKLSLPLSHPPSVPHWYHQWEETDPRLPRPCPLGSRLLGEEGVGGGTCSASGHPGSFRQRLATPAGPSNPTSGGGGTHSFRCSSAMAEVAWILGILGCRFVSKSLWFLKCGNPAGCWRMCVWRWWKLPAYSSDFPGWLWLVRSQSLWIWPTCRFLEFIAVSRMKQCLINT